MSDIVISCPHCDKKYTAKEKQHGIEVTCANCNLSFTVSIPNKKKRIILNLTEQEASRLVKIFIDIMAWENQAINNIDILKYPKEEFHTAFMTEIKKVAREDSSSEKIKQLQSMRILLYDFQKIDLEDIELVDQINKKYKSLTDIFKHLNNEERLKFLSETPSIPDEFKIMAKYKSRAADEGEAFEFGLLYDYWIKLWIEQYANKPIPSRYELLEF
jgi:hypothetical protein